MDWKDKIDEHHAGQTGFFKQIEMETNKKYTAKVVNTINDSIELFYTIDEALDFVRTELEWFNTFEKKSPYTVDDFIIEQF